MILDAKEETTAQWCVIKLALKERENERERWKVG